MTNIFDRKFENDKYFWQICQTGQLLYGWLDPKLDNVEEATYIGLGIIKYTSSYSQLFPLLMTECVQAGWQQLLGRGRMWK